MINNTAKKYIKALVEEYDKEEIISVMEILESLSFAFGIEKFNDIMDSPSVDEKEKIDLLLSFIQNPSTKFENFIKILAKNKRLDIIPQIAEGLKSNIAVMNNEYNGKIYSNQVIDEAKIKELEEKFSKKFGAKINLTPIVTDYNGIKIDLEDLGFEVSFSMDRLKSKMSEYILKAI